MEAILKRNPQVCLIDELAKDNPPGSRHEHRWQDVEEICAHGINVIGAFNLQHICGGRVGGTGSCAAFASFRRRTRS